MVCRRAVALLVLLSTAASGCVFRTYEPAALPQTTALDSVPHRARAHLGDGSVVVLRRGFVVRDGQLHGPGMRYDLTRRDSTAVTAIPMADVVELDVYAAGVNGPATAIGTTLGVLGSAAVIGLIIFAATFDLSLSFTY